jgi:septum site-determining protein MinC
LRLRGTAGGLSLLLEPGDGAPGLEATLRERAALLAERVEVELAGAVSPEALEAVFAAVRAAGGTVASVRSAREPGPPPIARTEIITKTLRSGVRREVGGSVIVLGDVNSGVELIAGGDVIVVGTLRGLAHAGARGRGDAIIWASRIAAPQVRIAGALARAPEGSSLEGMRAQEPEGPEIARLENGQIVIEGAS